MLERDRRLGFRIPLDLFLNQYIDDRPYRGLAVNLSDTGIFVNRVKDPVAPANRVVGLEFELPGTGEVIWARGEICYDQSERYFHGTGIRFTAMPRLYARMLRDYCIEARHAQLGAMLRRLRSA